MATLVLVLPEHRNMHNVVFAGFIIRNAVELSYGITVLFCKHKPILRRIGHIHFRQTIDIKTMLRMTAYIVYTSNKFIQVTVYCQAIDPKNQKIISTLVLCFTYETKEIQPQLFPASYHEAMMYIQGRREFQEFEKMQLQFKMKTE